MGGTAWSQQDLDALLGYLNDMPTRLVVLTHNQWARANGRPVRTADAITGKVRAMGLDRRSTGRWITTGTIASYLGCGHQRVYYWISKARCGSKGLAGRLMARRFPVKPYNFRKATASRRHLWWVSRADLRDFALRNPGLFAHLDRATVIELLDHEATADQVLATAPANRGLSKPVRCVETGQVYESISAAGRAVFASRGSLMQALRSGSPSVGYHWELA